MTTRHARFAALASPESMAFTRDHVLAQVNAWGLALERAHGRRSSSLPPN